ncbi:MAG: hypothetical protein QOJ10_1502 [Chloroflexota bacterium]|jgi:hypothetical protein|nr:hypothetical protein [Chloroflexota bacterium]
MIQRGVLYNRLSSGKRGSEKQEQGDREDGGQNQAARSSQSRSSDWGRLLSQGENQLVDRGSVR